LKGLDKIFERLRTARGWGPSYSAISMHRPEGRCFYHIWTAKAGRPRSASHERCSCGSFDSAALCSGWRL